MIGSCRNKLIFPVFRHSEQEASKLDLITNVIDKLKCEVDVFFSYLYFE